VVFLLRLIPNALLLPTVARRMRNADT